MLNNSKTTNPTPARTDNDVERISEYEPAGDQLPAFEALTRGFREEKQTHQHTLALIGQDARALLRAVKIAEDQMGR